CPVDHWYCSGGWHCQLVRVHTHYTSVNTVCVGPEVLPPDIPEHQALGRH
ncbi:unnamed protein product, partial [Candidula unifasciata]